MKTYKKIRYGLSLLMLCNVLILHAQAIPFYVDEVNYAVDIGHVNDGNISIAPNAVLSDEGDGSAPFVSIAPAVISSVKGAIVDGFHSDTAGRQYFSFDEDTLVGGTRVLKSDIIRCLNFACSSFNYALNAVTENLQHININAFTLDSFNGDLIFSIDGPAVIDGSSYLAADLIRYDGIDYTLEYDSTSNIDGIGAYKNINSVSMLSTGEFVITLEDDGFYKNEFSYDNHWILKYAPQNQSWQLFYTIFSFGEFENPLKITALMVQEDDLIFKDGFD